MKGKSTALKVGMWAGTAYFIYAALSPDGGILGNALHTMLDTVFGDMGRIVLAIIIPWAVGCLHMKPRAFIKPATAFIYYSVNAIALAGLLNIDMGVLAQRQADTAITFIGKVGLALVILCLDIIPFAGHIEHYVKQVFMTELRATMKSWEPARKIKTGAVNLVDGFTQTSPNHFRRVQEAASQSRQIGSDLAEVASVSNYSRDNRETALRQSRDSVETVFETGGGMERREIETAESGEVVEVIPIIEQVRMRFKLPAEMIMQINQLRADGISIRRIGKQTGVNRNTVDRILKALNEISCKVG
jgi:lambda repressor-like predicted transcriptional regulator